MNTLYLIGNGFDLACRLKSRYSDYFNNRFSKFPGFKINPQAAVESIKTEFENNGCENIPSAWFFVFAYEHDRRSDAYDSSWKDVELTIEHFVSDSTISAESLNIQICRKRFAESHDTGISSSVSAIVDLLYSYFVEKGNLAERLQKNQRQEIFIYDLFLAELESFEIDFRNYLKVVVEENDLYVRRANRLFNEMSKAKTPFRIETSLMGTVGGRMLEFKSEPDNQYILSFNYTNPFKNTRKKFVNVHGSLENEDAFFGIGGVDLYKEKDCLPLAVRFSKYRRASSLGVSGSNTSLDSFFRQLRSASGLQILKIFGLSMGEADYPYFKMFFDRAHLADGDDKADSFVGFYYTSGQDRDALIDAIDVIFQKYSSDTDYRPVGGLMRELQNTGRLVIEKLEDV